MLPGRQGRICCRPKLERLAVFSQPYRDGWQGWGTYIPNVRLTGAVTAVAWSWPSSNSYAYYAAASDGHIYEYTERNGWRALDGR